MGGSCEFGEDDFHARVFRFFGKILAEMGATAWLMGKDTNTGRARWSAMCGMQPGKEAGSCEAPAKWEIKKKKEEPSEMSSAVTKCNLQQGKNASKPNDMWISVLCVISSPETHICDGGWGKHTFDGLFSY